MTPTDEFQFPVGEAEGPRPYKVLVEQDELMVLLIDAALSYALVECPNGPDCEGCNAAYRIWWDLALALSRPARVAMQKHLAVLEIPVPPGPWEETDLEPKGE